MLLRFDGLSVWGVNAIGLFAMSNLVGAYWCVLVSIRNIKISYERLGEADAASEHAKSLALEAKQHE